ncbi:unnamed protein product [Urochloa humidicola]
MISLGCRYIDMGESLYQKCAPEAFHLNPVKWGVGLPCQLHVYTALLKPTERIMALDLPHEVTYKYGC